ncbi:uncharacterized protein At4g17910-like [Dendronephthya gigantea]|uniref:uncharacterized protein At4g17910-like n=1 Tax=Dendronephthya gigantea TaxID=151771 RepID=UPI00106B3425|nr:uncharacterized protein At4g17910-like [Dendronephthya gigantea]
MYANTNMAAESYRDIQKSFISNLNGTTALEISVVTSVAPFSVILRSLIWQLLAGNRQKLEGIFSISGIFVVEFITLIIPMFLIFTFLANYAFIFITILVLLTTTGLVFFNSKQNMTVPAPILNTKKRFLYNFRAYVNIATAISILAVDFTIYPRRFAKTETYGTGLMDVGVGSFIIANSVVCQDARGTVTTLSFVKAVKKELRAVLVLLALGLVRFIAVKTTDYQEHVSEYGVHWNFFLTLACVRVFSTIILRTLPESLGKYPWVIGLLIGLIYQSFLVNGLEEFVVNGSKGDGSRSNFIDANREGIASSFGYLSLYFIGISIGRIIFHRKDNCSNSLVNLLLSLICVSLLCWFILWYWGNKTNPERIISRRLANFPFVLWQVGYNVLLMTLLLAVDVVVVVFVPTQAFLRYSGGCWSCSVPSTAPQEQSTESSQPVQNWRIENLTQDSSHRRQSHKGGEESSQNTDVNYAYEKTELPVTKAGTGKNVSGCACLLSAVNYNLLAYFLLANILTGIVNLSLETIHASPIIALVIMNIYLLTLHAAITVFYKHNILLKL